MGIYKSKRRAVRRNHRERIKRSILKCPACREAIEFPSDKRKQAARLGIRVNTRKLCSCYMCGNKRKIEGKTIQERRHEQEEG